MAEKFPYTNVPKPLREFLKGIPGRAIPGNVTTRYLASIGFKSSNDRSILPVLKFVGLVDETGKPTTDYQTFRDKSKGPALLANKIREAYKNLYSTYEDAHNRNDEELQNFFRASGKLGERAVKYQVGTFKALSDFSDFSALIPQHVGSALPKSKENHVRAELPSIYINLQIHLPETKDAAVYDAIFQALARHILKESS